MANNAFIIFTLICIIYIVNLNVSAAANEITTTPSVPNKSSSSFKRTGNMRVKANTDAPIAIYNPNFLVSGNTPEEKALYFIKHNLKLLHLDHLLIESSSEELDLRLHFRHVTTTRANPVWTTVRFEQIYHGVSVYESDIAITINSNDVVVMVMFEYKNGIKINEKATKSPKQTDNDIIDKGLKRFGYNDTSKFRIFKSPAMFVYHNEDTQESNLVWNMKFKDNESLKQYEMLVNDEDGGIIFMKNKTDGKYKNNKKKTDKLSTSSLTKTNNLRHQTKPTSILNHHQSNLLLEFKSKEEKLQDLIQRLGDANNVYSIDDFVSDSVENILYEIMETVGLQSERRLDVYYDCAPRLILFLLDLLPDLTNIPPENKPVEFVTDIVDSVREAVESFLEGTFPCSQIPSFAPSLGSSVSPSISLVPTFQVIGNVFNPDPLTTSRGKYGDIGLSDSSDMDTDELNAQLVQVNLRHLDLSGPDFILRGRYAYIDDIDRPTTGLFISSSPQFLFTRQQNGFEAVNCYYHITTYMEYLEEDLGIIVRPSQYTGGVRFDPHGDGGEDNSYYSFWEEIVFGEGGVDDAEDADVILHELGHLIHDWITGHAGTNQIEGLSEGIGDYVANSYSRSLGHWTPDDDEYYRVFKWDGHNEFWDGRRTDVSRKYPDDLNYDIYDDGEIWSTCNMRIYEAIGRIKSDKAFWIGISATNRSSNQEDAANAIVTAAIDLGYSDEDILNMKNLYRSCGYVIFD